MGWTIQPARTAFPDCAPIWDSLNREQGGHVLLDSLFVGALLEHFGHEGVLLCRLEGRSQAGFVLVHRPRSAAWETFQPSQSPLGLLLLRADGESEEILRSLLAALPGFSLSLSVLQQDPDYSCLGAVRESTVTRKLDYIETSRVSVPESFESYWRARSKNLRHNLGRQRRRLRDEGIVPELRIHRDAGAMQSCVSRYAELEASGWKAGTGTAVLADNEQGRFYRDVLERFAERGEAVVYQLCLDGNVVASDLCLERNGMQVVLKTACDGTIRRFSSALLMREDILRSVAEEGRTNVIEYYGRVLDWHRQWATGYRSMYHINFWRNRLVALLRSGYERLRR